MTKWLLWKELISNKLRTCDACGRQVYYTFVSEVNGERKELCVFCYAAMKNAITYNRED